MLNFGKQNLRGSSVVAMVKVENGGEQYIFDGWGVYQSNAYCMNDAGTTGVNCKTSLAPGELQTTGITDQYGTATYTYGINNIAYNVKVSPQASGLLDSNKNIVKTVGACTATNSFWQGYTLVSINCDSAPVPTYDATTYTTGVKKRGVNLSGQEWASGTYSPTLNDVNKIKAVGFNAARLPIDITKLSDSSGNIDWTSGNAKAVDTSMKLLMSNGMQEVILDVHNQLVGPQTAGNWAAGQITGAQLLKFWQQAAPRYASYSNFAIGVVNEPHDISANPGDAQTEASALSAIYMPIVQWFSANQIQSPSYWEPSDYGGIADYANIVWQNMYTALVAASAYPDTMIADGHAYGTNPGAPGGSGYGDCEPDGVAHNNLQAVGDFLVSQGFTGAITEYNGDPSYANCRSYVETTVEYMNSNASPRAQRIEGGFDSNYLWGYYLNTGSTDPLDINKNGSPQTDPQIVAMQGYGDLIPGQLAGAPTAVPTAKPSFRPTAPTGQPSSHPTSPTGQPTGRPSVQPSSWPTLAPSAPSSMPSGAPTSIPAVANEVNLALWLGCAGAFIALAGVYAGYRHYQNGGTFFGLCTPKERKLGYEPLISSCKA